MSAPPDSSSYVLLLVLMLGILVCHSRVKGYLLACFFAGILASTLSFLHYAFWGFLLARSAEFHRGQYWANAGFTFLAFPIGFIPALVIGLPFLWFRRRSGYNR